MKQKIKSYELNQNITIKKLEENNFEEDGMIKEVSEPKYSYIKTLVNDITLHLEIGTNEGNLYFNDGNHILIMDEKKHKPYYPFYFDKEEDEYLDKVISEYNKVMDELVLKGILCEKKLDNDKIKKLTK